MKKKRIFPYLLLAIIFLASLFFRLWFVSDYHFNFFYDQSRDAINATKIANGDLAIFGPSASGTQDTFYHGVIWYYFLAPLYAISANPQIAINGLTIFLSLSLLVVFFVSKKIFKNNYSALLTTFLMAFSSISVVNSTWLSNPSLVYFILPIFIYFSWKTWNKLTFINFSISCFLLGLLVQIVFFGIYWGLLLIIIFIWHLIKKSYNWQKIIYTLIGGILAFCLSTSTMIVAQLLLIKRGILSLEILEKFSSGTLNKDPISTLQNIFHLWGTIVGRSLFPQYLAAGLVIVIILLIYYKKIETNRKNFFILCLSIPPIFMLFYFRNNLHFLGAYEFLIYLVITDLLTKNFKNKKIIVFISCLFFISINTLMITKLRYSNLHYNNQQKNVSLKDQLALIDKTYELAEKQPFTFSSTTNPYGIDSTWHYLYNWYGREKYGFVPTYIGPSQQGFPHYKFIPENSEYRLLTPTHFTIYEPETGLDSRLETLFIEEQQRLAGTPSAMLNFGALGLAVH